MVAKGGAMSLRDAAIVSPSGVLDPEAFAALRREVIASSAAGGPVVVDLAAVSAVDPDVLPDLPASLEWAAELGIAMADGRGMLAAAESGGAAVLPAQRTVATAVSSARPVVARQRAVADFPADVTSARSAREFVATACRRWSLGALELDATIVVSELVENAVRHCDSACSIALELGHRLLAIGVADSSRHVPRLLNPGPDEPGGRGLVLTDAVCRRWGYRQVRDGKVVWALLQIPDELETASGRSELAAASS